MAVGTATLAALAAAQVIGGLVGQNQQRQAAAGAQAARDRAMQGIAGVEIPDIEKMKLAFEMPELIGQYNPLLETELQLGPSSMEGVSTDPRLAQAQMSALEQLSGYSKGEMTPADAMALEQIRRNSASQGQARQQAILSEMQQRGQGGSGAELIARLKAGQAEADRASQEGAALQQMLQQRALQAITNQATLGGSMRSQEFGEKSDIAKAKDIVNQFNLQNKQNVGQRNVGQQNEAQAMNLRERQRIADQAVALRNQQQQLNQRLQQDKFNNEMRRAQALAGQYDQNAAALTQRGQADSQGITDTTGGLINMIGIGSMMGGNSSPASIKPTEQFMLPAQHSPFMRS